MYGDGYDEVLETENREIKKYSVEDLTNLEKQYKIEVEKLVKGHYE